MSHIRFASFSSCPQLPLKDQCHSCLCPHIAPMHSHPNVSSLHLSQDPTAFLLQKGLFHYSWSFLFNLNLLAVQQISAWVWLWGSQAHKVTTWSSSLLRQCPCLYTMLISAVPAIRENPSLNWSSVSVEQRVCTRQPRKSHESVSWQGSILDPPWYKASILETPLPLLAGFIRMTSPFGKGSSPTKPGRIQNKGVLHVLGA